MKFVNKIPHKVTIIDDSGDIIEEFPPAEKSARVEQFPKDLEYIDDIPVMTDVEFEVNGLPDPEPGVMYIVSGFVRNVLSNRRDDLISPDMSEDSIVNDLTPGADLDGVKRMRVY